MRRHVTAPDRIRETKRRTSRFVTNRLVNPLVRRAIDRGAFPSNWVLLETTGRKSGEKRTTPVGNGLRGDVFWIVTEHGYASHYVRNIQQDPRVRIRIPGRGWLSGTATILPDDDPYERLGKLRRPLNDAALLAVGTEQLVVRIDLDPA